MWVSTKRIYYLVQICSNVFVLNDLFAKLVHGVSKSAVSAAQISMDFLGWFLMVPPKKTWNHQIFRIFLLDLKWLRLKLFLGGRGLCHFEEMILKKAARGWLDIDLLWAPWHGWQGKGWTGWWAVFWKSRATGDESCESLRYIMC